MKHEWIFYGLVIAALSVGAYERNRVWLTEIGLWRDCVKKAPNKQRPYENLSAALIWDQKFEEAIPYARKALSLGEDDYIPYQHLGIIYFYLRDRHPDNLIIAYAYGHEAAVMERNVATLVPLGLIIQAMGGKVVDGKVVYKEAQTK